MCAPLKARADQRNGRGNGGWVSGCRRACAERQTAQPQHAVGVFHQDPFLRGEEPPALTDPPGPASLRTKGPRLHGRIVMEASAVSTPRTPHTHRIRLPPPRHIRLLPARVGLPLRRPACVIPAGGPPGCAGVGSPWPCRPRATSPPPSCGRHRARRRVRVRAGHRSARRSAPLHSPCWSLPDDGVPLGSRAADGGRVYEVSSAGVARFRQAERALTARRDAARRFLLSALGSRAGALRRDDLRVDGQWNSHQRYRLSTDPRRRVRAWCWCR